MRSFSEDVRTQAPVMQELLNALIRGRGGEETITPSLRSLILIANMDAPRVQDTKICSNIFILVVGRTLLDSGNYISG
jgi:hypothetical protein